MPIRLIRSICCALAANGQAPAAPPSSVMNFASSFNHLVGASESVAGTARPSALRSGVDDQFEFGRLLIEQVSGFSTFQDLVGQDRCAKRGGGFITGSRMKPPSEHPRGRCTSTETGSTIMKAATTCFGSSKWIGDGQDRIRALTAEREECPVEVVAPPPPRRPRDRDATPFAAQPARSRRRQCKKDLRRFDKHRDPREVRRAATFSSSIVSLRDQRLASKAQSTSPPSWARPGTRPTAIQGPALDHDNRDHAGRLFGGEARSMPGATMAATGQ